MGTEGISCGDVLTTIGRRVITIDSLVDLLERQRTLSASWPAIYVSAR